MAEDLKTTEQIYNVVTTTKEYVAVIDSLLENEVDSFVIPRAALEGLRAALDLNAYLVATLFENGQEILDKVEAVAEKFKKETDAKGPEPS